MMADAEMLTKAIEDDIVGLDSLNIPREDSEELLQGIVKICMKCAEKLKMVLKDEEMKQKLQDIHHEVNSAAE